MRKNLFAAFALSMEIKTKNIQGLFFLLLVSFNLMGQPGALVPGFAEKGILVHTNPSIFKSIGIQADGRMVVKTGSNMIRFNSDGTRDLSFGVNGTASGHNGVMKLQSDGKIILVTSNAVYRYTVDGIPDPTFGEGGVSNIDVFGVTVSLYDVAIDGEGKIVTCGEASWMSGADKIKTIIVVRLNSDGSLDTGFNGGGIRIQLFSDFSNTDRVAYKCAIDLQNRIVLAVDKYTITVVNGITYGLDDYPLIRYKTDGTMDQGFNNVFDSPTSIKDMAVNSEGKIIYVNTYNALSRYFPHLQYVDDNGTQILSEEIQSRSAEINSFALQPNDKILLAGYVLTQTLQNNLWIARYNPDLKIDEAFGSNGMVTMNLNFTSRIEDIIWNNKRIYASGEIDLSYVGDNDSYGLIMALDGTTYKLIDRRDTTASTDQGKCYATVNNIDPVFLPATNSLTVQYKLENNGVITQGSGSVSGKQFQLGTTHVTYTYADVTTQTASFDVTVRDIEPPVVKCKNITVQLDATGNATINASQVDDGSTDGCGIQSRSLSKTTFDCSNVGANTVTLTVTDVHGNASTCTSTITIEDKTPPVVKTKNITAYLDAAGVVTVAAADVDNGSSDECGAVTLTIDKPSFTCAHKGTNTVLLTAKDPNGNSSSATATVTVVDTIPPTITSVSANPAGLFPSDRKMHPVTITAAYFDNCTGTAWSVTGVAIKSGEFANDNINPDYEITGQNTVNLRAEIPKKGIRRVYTVTITATDAAGNTATSTVDVSVSHNITSPLSGAVVKLGSTVSLSGEFWDKSGKTHTAKWLIDDNTIVKASVVEPSGLNNGTVSGSYKFSNAGVYKIRMNVTDQNGITTYANTCENLEAIVVVYDPNGGYTYGGGYFASPAGALKSNPSATGDVSYGFTVNYYKNATLPKGETQFDFKLGDFEYNAVNFDYLAIAGAKAQFKGTGKIVGGQSGINFIATVVDGQLDGTGIDKLRIKIYNKNTGEVYYDNQPGASDAADAVTSVGLSSTIVVQSTINNALTQKNTSGDKDPGMIKEFDVKAYPNPTASGFTLQITAGSDSPTEIRISNGLGQLVKTIRTSDQTVRFGEELKTGVYVVEVVQATNTKTIKLIKL